MTASKCYHCKHSLIEEGKDFTIKTHQIKWMPAGKIDTVLDKRCLHCGTLIYGEVKPLRPWGV